MNRKVYTIPDLGRRIYPSLGAAKTAVTRNTAYYRDDGRPRLTLEIVEHELVETGERVEYAAYGANE